MIISSDSINHMEKFYRVNFINSLTGFKSASLIGTINPNGHTNLAVFNSVIHVGANPPLMGFLMRPVNVPRHTYHNIKANGYFTINHINSNLIKPAHQTSARYPEDVSEFEATGLTVEYTEKILAPYVKESIIKIGLKFVEEFTIKTNETKFIVGEILEVIIPEEIIEKDGIVDLEKAGTVTIRGLDSYHETKLLERMPYAKP